MVARGGDRIRYAGITRVPEETMLRHGDRYVRKGFRLR